MSIMQHGGPQCASICSKKFNRPKCGKCRGGHKIENYGLKCSYYFGLGHTKEHCWKKNGKGLATSTNVLEVLINDVEATLIKLNRLCGMKNNIFLGTRISRRRNQIVTLEIDKNEKELHEEDITILRRFGNELITKSKFLTHFLMGKI